MNYRIDIIDTFGRRIASYDEVPLLRAVRTAPDEPDEIRGILPGPVADLSHGYIVQVYVNGALFLECPVTQVRPQWSDTRKLIIDRFVYFHEVIEFEAQREARHGNTRGARAFMNRPIHEIVKLAINTAPGPDNYLVDHTA